MIEKDQVLSSSQKSYLFNEFDRFLQTSETGKLKILGKDRLATRLNTRHSGLLLSNEDLIAGKNVLDLASHDGRWSFAALKVGAKHVTGIEHKPRLIRKTTANFEHYAVDTDSYQFIQGDIFEHIPKVTQRIDTVFCFGIFYHISHHMHLLSQIDSLGVRGLILDTEIVK
ncbi:MAG: methyltransferase domain-containing protein [Pseudomonadota bacterium]